MKGRIIHVVYECIPGQFKGGVQKVSLELACAQKSLGLDVELWTLSGSENWDSVIFNDVPVRYFKSESVFGVFGSKEMLDELQKMKSLISVVHAHNTFHRLNLQVGAFCKKNSVSVFYHPHGALDPSLFSGLSFQSIKKKLYIKFFEARNLKIANGIFALTENEKLQLCQLGVKDNIIVLPNGISDNEFIDVIPGFRKANDLDQDAKIFLFVGRIVPKKGLHIFLEVFSKLIDKIDNCYFVIAGNVNQQPDYSESLYQLIKKLDISKNIIWLGFLDENTKPDVFNSADIFIHASYSEGMAMSVLEAMSYGLPCLVTEGCYMSEAANHNAVIECQQSVSALFESSLDLITNEKVLRELRKNSISYINENHDWLKIAEKTKQYYGL